MPHYRIDPESLEEYADELPGGFEPNYYESAEATVNFATLRDGERLRDGLLAAGFVALTCAYDGGYDEGFARFDSAIDAAGDAHDAVARRLGLDADAPGRSPWLSEHLPPATVERIGAGWASKSVGHKIDNVFFGLVEQLASRLLGESFGTGELALRGRFRCDLATGEVVDIEADPPESDYFKP